MALLKREDEQRRPNMMIYFTKDGVKERAIEYCERTGITMSKLGQLALIEKFEREGKLIKSLQGSRIHTPASQAEEVSSATSTTTETASAPKAGSLIDTTTNEGLQSGEDADVNDS